VYPGYPIVIGSDPTAGYSGGQPGTYTLDDMGIWNRLLSPTEVAGIYIAGTNGITIGGSGNTIVQLIPQLISGGKLQLSWSQGTLQSTTNLPGPWSPVTNATPPTFIVTPSESQQFYRVR
jgi:hypothetical protein